MALPEPRPLLPEAALSWEPTMCLFKDVAFHPSFEAPLGHPSVWDKNMEGEASQGF